MLALITRKINNKTFEVRAENNTSYTIKPSSKDTLQLLEELFESEIIFDFNPEDQSINSPYFTEAEREFTEEFIEGVE